MVTHLALALLSECELLHEEELLPCGHVLPVGVTLFPREWPYPDVVPIHRPCGLLLGLSEEALAVRRQILGRCPDLV